MANQSIFAAFERMWQHVTNALSGKANASHTHDYIPNSLKGAANGLAELDSSGKVPSSQLPSYVDDVIQGTYVSTTSFKNASGTVITGETGKIYVDTTSNKTYRWSGSAFVEISASLALGETSSTAYRGDRGKIAYDHSQAAHAPADAEKNQNAFSSVTVGSTTISADSTTDTLTLVAGPNVTITPDATTDQITIAATDTKYTLPKAGSDFGGVKTGGDVTITDGVITVNDDSHNHTITNVDGLQDALNVKVPTTRKVNNKVLSADISLTASDVGAATTNDITNAINALDSTVSAESGKYISAITQTNGKITATKESLPTIPTVNNATLTIQKNGTSVATFTANSATNTTANITVPTGAAADKGVDTSISAGSTSTKLPTSKAVAAFVEGKGYKTTDNNTTYDLAASASSANGNVKLNLTAGGSGSGTDSVSIKGSGATTVTTDANGVITISSVEQKPVYVTLTLEMGGYSSDVTYSQIKSAHDAGSSIYCKVIGTSDYGISYGDFCLPLTRLGLGDNSFIFQGTFEARDEEAYNVTKGITVTINSVSNNVEFSTISHPQIYDFIEAKTEVKMKIWTTDDIGGT